MPSRFSLIATTATLATLSWFSATSNAAVIIQASGTDYLAYEAEDDLVTAAGWSSVGTDPAASGSGALTSGGPTSSSGAGSSSLFTHTIQFAEAGTYSLYIRRNSGNANNGDGVFAANAFDSTSSVSAVSIGKSSEYRWTETSLDFTISEVSGSGPAVGEELNYTIKRRASNFIVDRIVFSTQAGLSSTQLDALTNSTIPEPASLALVGLGGLLLMTRKPRG